MALPLLPHTDGPAPCRDPGAARLVDGPAPRQDPKPAPDGTVVELTPDGAWSWFSEPRAFCVGDTLVAAWVTSDGRLQTGVCGLETLETGFFDVVTEFESDDHSHPILVRTRDGRYSAFYSIHAGASTFMMYRVTLEPHDMSEWSTPRDIETNTPGFGGVTYPNPVSARRSADTLLVFWRGANWNPTFTTINYDSERARVGVR